MKIRSVAAMAGVVTAAVLAISAQSASANVPTIGHLAASAPSGTRLSVCELAIKVPECDAIPGRVVSAMRNVPSNSAGAVQVAKSLGLAGESPAFAYCRNRHVSGTSGIEKDCVLISVLV